MWQAVGLLGLLAALMGVTWLVAAAFLRGPRRWVGWLVVLGLGVFALSTLLPASEDVPVVSPEVTPLPSLTPILGGPAGPSVESKGVQPGCSQPPVFAGDAVRVFRDDAMMYGLMQAASYPSLPTQDDGIQTVWIVLGVKNTGATSVEVNPWFDFWLMPLPLGMDMPYPPQPTHVDVLEIRGPIRLPNQGGLLLGAGRSCMLQLTFRLAPQAERAILNIGYVQAFTMDLTSRGSQQQ